MIHHTHIGSHPLASVTPPLTVIEVAGGRTASLSLDSVVSKPTFVRSRCIMETRRGVAYDIMIYGDIDNAVLVCLTM